MSEIGKRDAALRIKISRYGREREGYAAVSVSAGGRKVVTFDFQHGVVLTQTDGQARVVQRYPDLLRRAKAALGAPA